MNSSITIIGFNDEYLDQTLDNYHLGNGYRAYNPTTMQFSAPDNMSPFDKGGINSYMYVSGDPINNTDPTGHFNYLGFATGAGLTGYSLVSIAMAIPTLGASLAGAAAVISIAGSTYGAIQGVKEAITASQQAHNGLGTEETINLGVTVGGEVLGVGVARLGEKLSATLAKIAEHGPYRLSGRPEDALYAGRAFAPNTRRVRFAPLPPEQPAPPPQRIFYSRAPGETPGRAINRELESMYRNRNHPNFDSYTAIAHKTLKVGATRNPLYVPIRVFEVNSRHIELTMQDITYLRNEGRYLGWNMNENRAGTYYHYIADNTTPPDVLAAIQGLRI